MIKDRYYFTLSEYDLVKVDLLKGLSSHRQLSKFINRLLELYIKSVPFQNIVNDMRVRDESAQLDALDVIFKDPRLYQELNMDKEKLASLRTVYGFRYLRDFASHIPSIQDVGDKQNATDIDVSTGGPVDAGQGEHNVQDIKQPVDVDSMIEENTENIGEDAGDDFELFEL